MADTPATEMARENIAKLRAKMAAAAGGPDEVRPTVAATSMYAGVFVEVARGRVDALLEQGTGDRSLTAAIAEASAILDDCDRLFADGDALRFCG